MPKHMIIWTLVVLCTISLVVTATPSNAQQEDTRYFAETGFEVAEPFLHAWEQTPEAMDILGMPISYPFMEERSDRPGRYYRVQYFERAVLEEHTEYAGIENNQYLVQGRLLGRIVSEQRADEQPFQPIANPGDGTWFAETRHTLRDEPAPFRTFFYRYGGIKVFGYPLSEPFEEINADNGMPYIVQYFERQRLEWHPDLAGTNYEVTPGLLGIEYRDSRYDNYAAFDADLSHNDVFLPPFIYGYNAMLYHNMAPWQDRKRVLQIAKDSGIYWIRQQVAWKDLHKQNGDISWGELDAIVEDVHQDGMRLLISVVQAPWWATSNGLNGLPTEEHFETFAFFMGQMAARYQGRVQAYEIWNEQNLACQNGGDCSKGGSIGGQVVEPDHYVEMLFQAYQAIKAADPTAIVVSGATASTELNDPDFAMSDRVFMKHMLANPRFRADVIGVHPGDRNNPPDTLWPYNPGPGPGWQRSREFYFRRVEDIRDILVAYGKEDKQIWITEFGWATPNITPGFEYGNENSFEEQAEWIVRAFEKGRYEYTPWVGAMFVWNLNFAVSWKGANNNELHEQASYSVLNGDWTPRPAWYAIRDMPKH